ncbi:MAG: TetR/AcrR family transcriptional regulator [Caulobacteraceae bacterium]
MRYDAEHKRQTREKVLDAAAEAIRLEGPHKVGVAGVMARAGLTHGGFYAHFESKDDLVAHAITHMFDKSALRRIDAHEGPAAGRGPLGLHRLLPVAGPPRRAHHRLRHAGPGRRPAAPALGRPGELRRRGSAA